MERENKHTEKDIEKGKVRKGEGMNLKDLGFDFEEASDGSEGSGSEDYKRSAEEGDFDAGEDDHHYD